MRQESDNSDWVEFRKNHIGSSEAYTIWQGKDAELLSLWEEKKGLGKEFFLTDAMAHGKAMEPVAREFFNQHIGDVFLPDVRESKEYPWMGASLDGVNLSNKSLLEIKCPYSSNLLVETKQGNVPERYYFQMLHQMMTTAIYHTYFFVYQDEENFAIREIEYDAKLAKELFGKEKAFWDLVVSNTPPIKERDDFEWMALEQEYWEFAAAEKLLAEKKEEVLNRMKELSGNSTAFGPTLMLSKYLRKGNIDYGKIPELSSVNLDLYRKEPSVCWRASKR